MISMGVEVEKDRGGGGGARVDVNLGGGGRFIDVGLFILPMLDIATDGKMRVYGASTKSF